MQRLMLAAGLALAAVPALAADVGVSVSVGQPGFYGRIDVGAFPQPPQVVYPQPVIIQPGPVGVVRRPIYLHVPPGHARDWGRHCRQYNACGQPVYFVQDRWYDEVYVPRHRADPRYHRDDHHHEGRGHGHGHDKDRDEGHGRR